VRWHQQRIVKVWGPFEKVAFTRRGWTIKFSFVEMTPLRLHDGHASTCLPELHALAGLSDDFRESGCCATWLDVHLFGARFEMRNTQPIEQRHYDRLLNGTRVVG
jgi:hypothetical protein